MYRILLYLSFLTLAIALLSACASGKASSSAIQAVHEMDGSSFEKAIPVKSIDEEYDWVAGHYPGSKFLGQTLVFKDKKPFDRLRIVLSDGSEKDVYFDISKFFGKF